MWVVAAASVAVAGKWDGEPAEVAVTQVVAGPIAPIQALLSDWQGWQRALPATCASEWEIADPQGGVGARATALYQFGPLRRRRTGVITKVQPDQLVELELQGEKGWFTQVTYAPAADGSTSVTITTPLTRPKWPLTGVFFARVRPAWEACYRDTLAAIPALL